MRKTSMVVACMLSMPWVAVAQPVDIIGGADGSTQTMYHCGMLKVTAADYANSPVLVGVIERKLRHLGYGGHSRYRTKFSALVKAFQADYGLQADGIVGPRTAQKLAYIGHPSAHVRGCDAMTDGSR